MTYNAVIEDRQPDGFVATTMGWPHCSVTAPTRADALRQLREEVARHLSRVEVVSFEVEASETTHPWARFAGMFKDDPMFDDVLEYIEEYRRELDADDTVP